MPGKALAGVAAFVIAAGILGCGGGDGDPSDSGLQETGGAVAADGPARVEGLRRRVEDVRRHRRSEAAQATQASPAPSALGSDGSDSGGGASQFRSSGDNSVQEFGREAPVGERERASAALHGYLDSRAAGHWAATCGYMSATLVVTLEHVGSLSRRRPKPKGCADILAALSGHPGKVLREVAEADVGSMRVEGDRSFLLYRGARGFAFAMPMVREEGDWKVASIAAAPLQ